MYVNSIKIGNAIKYIQNVAYLSELPVANENSADLVSVNNELYVKQVNGATYTYAKVGGSGSGTAFIDITGLDVLPIEYQNEETLKTAILYDTDHLLRLTWIDDMYYFGNTDDFQYRYLSIDTSDWVIMRYDLQEIAKAPKVVNLNTYVPSTATNGTLTSEQLSTLQASDQNYIIFNNELFRLNDKQSSEGYLVYSHNGHDTTGCFFQKCITITISTLGWVLETQENQAKLTAGSGITIENNVISSTGGGSTTTDTAYVSNSTLYIEEGTTAGGGGSEEKALEVEVLTSDISASSIAIDDNIITLTFGASMVISYGMIEEGKTYNNYVNITNAFAKTDSNWYQNLKNGYYDKLVLKSPTELPEIPYMSSELKYNKFVGRYEFSTFGTQIIAPNDYTFTFFNQFLEVSESTMPDGITKIYSAILYTQYYRPVKNQQIIE